MILPSLELDQILWLSLLLQLVIPLPFFRKKCIPVFQKCICNDKFSLNTKEDNSCILNSVLYFEALEEAEKNHHKFCFRFHFFASHIIWRHIFLGHFFVSTPFIPSFAWEKHFNEHIFRHHIATMDFLSKLKVHSQLFAFEG